MNAHTALRVAVLAGGVALTCTACGGGGGARTLPSTTLAANTTSVAAPAANAQGGATFSLTVPSAASATASNRRRVSYVSSQTAAVSIDVRQNGSEVNGFPVSLGTTPGSPNCVTGSSGTTCALSISVLPGNYTASLTALDASARALSTAVAVPLNIAAGAVTSVPLTLDGVVASLAVNPVATGGASFVSGSMSAGYALIGQGPRSFTMSALDASGNTIVGPGAPALSVSISGSIPFSPVLPTPSAPNTFTLSAPGVWTAGSDQIAVSATYSDGTPCAALSGTCTANVNVSMRELLLVNDTGGTALSLYADGDTAPLATIAQGVSQPSPVWWSHTGDIFSGNESPEGVAVFSYPYRSAPYATITTSANTTNGIIWTAIVDPAGDLLVTDFFGNAIRVYAPPFSTPGAGVSTPAYTITDGIAAPGNFVVDRQGNVYVGNGSGGAQLPYETIYAAHTFQKTATIAPPFVNMNGFCCVTQAVSPNGKLAISSSTEPSVFIYNAPFTNASTPVATVSPGVNGGGISFDASDELFVATPTGGVIYAPPYTTPFTFAPSTPVTGCSMDDRGTLYCMQPSGTEMDVFPKPWSSTPSVRVALSPQSTAAPQIIP